ncbi:MAG: 50S ribosomal protein L1 [Alphaproteobacteria bacterium]|nr:50S ribosomal protein L1 [Alphaproteobacteria bacterium]MDA7982916.1 50S ribosomal protein L1 [Alphaproteobacteria bacterium]MDA7983943.1 50S ribosomal protein L1 [Alphaproteobacteria bacterium]MDA7986906.1 50S ribosomal protein L1 [Alphaproteobacteria bacterium]MDA7988397.1 50S ribosomal protein L1 [Alphaproteobacteria bacterium]
MSGKRMREAKGAVKDQHEYPLAEAVSLLQSLPAAKFDETVELALNLGVDPRQSEQNVRGMVALPHGTGRAVRVAVFARGDRADEAKKAGAHVVGAEDLAESVRGGEINFDRAIATPDMMPLVGQLGRILGPRGLMPNPRLGTVTMDVAAAVAAALGGQVEYRVDKAGIVHAAVGKRSFSSEHLQENVRALVDAVRRAKPGSSKGVYMRRATLSSTMGPGIRLSLGEI